MGDFVPDGFLDELAEVGRAAGKAFVGTLVDGDAIGHGPGFGNAAVREGAAFIEAKETGLAGFGFDDEDEVVKARAEAAGDDLHGLFDEPVKVGGGHG